VVHADPHGGKSVLRTDFERYAKAECNGVIGLGHPN
jgi:hypothetical protein